MPPWRLIHPQLAILNMLHLEFIVCRLKVKVIVTGNDNRLGANTVQRFGEIILMKIVVTDVAGQPGLQHCQKIVCIPVEVILLPVKQYVFCSLQTQCLMQTLAVPGL